MMNHSPVRAERTVVRDQLSPLGGTVKNIRRFLNGAEERTFTATGRPVQFDHSFGRRYGSKKLGNLNEVPTYRFDGGYKNETQSSPHLTNMQNTVVTDTSAFQSFYM